MKRLACGAIENKVAEPFIAAFINVTKKLAGKENKKIHFLVVQLNDFASHPTVNLSAKQLIKGGLEF